MIDTSNMVSLIINQLLIKHWSDLYAGVQRTLKARLEQEKIILLSK